MALPREFVFLDPPGYPITSEIEHYYQCKKRKDAIIFSLYILKTLFTPVSRGLVI